MWPWSKQPSTKALIKSLTDITSEVINKHANSCEVNYMQNMFTDSDFGDITISGSINQDMKFVSSCKFSSNTITKINTDLVNKITAEINSKYKGLINTTNGKNNIEIDIKTVVKDTINNTTINKCIDNVTQNMFNDIKAGNFTLTETGSINQSMDAAANCLATNIVDTLIENKVLNDVTTNVVTSSDSSILGGIIGNPFGDMSYYSIFIFIIIIIIVYFTYNYVSSPKQIKEN